MKQIGMKDIKDTEKSAKAIVSDETEFKGYTIEEIRFQRALVAMEAEFCKAKCQKSWANIQSANPLSPSKTSLPGKAGTVALKLVNGLNYMDYILLGISVFNGAKKVMSLFRKRRKK